MIPFPAPSQVSSKASKELAQVHRRLDIWECTLRKSSWWVSRVLLAFLERTYTMNGLLAWGCALSAASASSPGPMRDHFSQSPSSWMKGSNAKCPGSLFPDRWAWKPCYQEREPAPLRPWKQRWKGCFAPWISQSLSKSVNSRPGSGRVRLPSSPSRRPLIAIGHIGRHCIVHHSLTNRALDTGSSGEWSKKGISLVNFVHYAPF